jgi:hypothetical protein
MIDEVDSILLDEFDIRFHYFCYVMGVQGVCKSALLYDEHFYEMIRSNPFRIHLHVGKGHHSCRLLLSQIGDNSLKLYTKRTKKAGIEVPQFQSILLL